MNMHWTSARKNLILLIVSLVFALSAGELLARALLPASEEMAANNHYKFYHFDPILGWAHDPDNHGVLRRSEFSNDININRYGMRYRDIPIDPSENKVRVAVMGDSFTWGIGVQDSDRFTERTEGITSNKFELLNFGVSGYGPLQHLLNLDHVLKFKPKIVLLTFSLGNDFVDNVFWRRYGYYKPYVTKVSNAGLEIEGYPLPLAKHFVAYDEGSFMRWLQQNSRLFQEISAASGKISQLVGLGQAGLKDADEAQSDMYSRNMATAAAIASSLSVQINKNILQTISSRLAKDNIEFAVIVAPSKCEFGQCKSNKLSPNWAIRELLLQTLSELKVPAIDRSDEFSIADFWADDGHWRPSGHEKIAIGVADWLEKNEP